MKNTEELIQQIKEQKINALSFLEQREYSCPSVSIYLNDLLAEHRMETKDAIRNLGLERTYGYQLFNGTRKPTRTLLIRLAILLGLGLEETNRLLKIGRKEILYPRIREDAAAIFAIEKRLPLSQFDELMERL